MNCIIRWKATFLGLCVIPEAGIGFILLKNITLGLVEIGIEIKYSNTFISKELKFLSSNLYK